MGTFGMTDDQVEAVWRRWREGQSVRAVARAEQVPLHRVQGYLRDCGGIKPAARTRGAGHLSLPEREEVSRGLAAGESLRSIGRRLCRPHSTISREIARNGGGRQYRAGAADGAASHRAHRPKPAKLAARSVLREWVEAGLEREWSPQQVAARLLLDFPDDSWMRVSHETIYASIYQGRKGALRRGMHRNLRTGRLFRRPKRAEQGHGRGKIRDMTPVADRPAEAQGRAVAGHLEGDLVMGRRPSAVATLVDRSTRFVRIVKLPAGIKAEPVRVALAAELNQHPPVLRRTLTWDQGRELAEHQLLAQQTDCPVFFCDPHSPWQRGTNENTNGLLRQYLPRTRNLYDFSQIQLDAIADRLNNRPRACLGWRTPAEAQQQALNQDQMVS